MNNIHELDKDTVNTLVNMLNSDDSNTVKMALTILNNADFNDSKIVEAINELQNKCSGLHFALFVNRKKEIRARFNYVYFYNNRPIMIDDDSSLDDNDEYIPYDPYDDLSDELKFNYK